MVIEGIKIVNLIEVDRMREILIPGIKNPFCGIVNGNWIPSQIQKNKRGIKTIVVHLNENPNLLIHKLKIIARRIYKNDDVAVAGSTTNVLATTAMKTAITRINAAIQKIKNNILPLRPRYFSITSPILLPLCLIETMIEDKS